MEAGHELRALASRAGRVRARVARAAEAAGREPDSIRIVPVTKGHPASAVRLVLEAGFDAAGENRIEELESKASLISEQCAWHMIGHVQSRKAARVARLAAMTHSVDRLKLAKRLSRACLQAGREMGALLQVNASGERSKFGFGLAEARDAAFEIASLPGLALRGLMTMAPFTSDARLLAKVFERTRTLAEDLGKEGLWETPELSMGMSNDFEIAIREGSTMLRLGTILVGARPKPGNA